MRLTELEPTFIRFYADGARRFHEDVASISEANGLEFLCPECTRKGVHAHTVIVVSPDVGADCPYGPGRWRLEGTSFADLSLVAGSSSVKLSGGCNAHFHVTNGEILFSADSGGGA